MTIIYTSGTTGEPKGVMLSHRNLVANVLHTARRVDANRDDLALEFLPLSHVLERMAGYCFMWAATSKAYCSVVHVGDLIGSIRPTIFTGVPRFYEKVQQKILDAVAAAPPVKRALFDWAVGVGREAALRRIAGREIGGTLGARHRVADRLVLSKVREGLGGRLRFSHHRRRRDAAARGGVLPLARHLADRGLRPDRDLSGDQRQRRPSRHRCGSAPPAAPSTTSRSSWPRTASCWCAGRASCSGTGTSPRPPPRSCDGEGWLSTGDIVEIDDDGFLLIVDRKKDIIVTAGGKNVAPQPIEGLLKRSTVRRRRGPDRRPPPLRHGADLPQLRRARALGGGQSGRGR